MAGRKGHDTDVVLAARAGLGALGFVTLPAACVTLRVMERGCGVVPRDGQGRTENKEGTKHARIQNLCADGTQPCAPVPAHQPPAELGLFNRAAERVGRTIPVLLAAGSVLYFPDNCNPNSHSSALVICHEIIYAR